MNNTNQTYSGKYYQFKEHTYQELSASRIWLRHQYYRTFISLSVITLFVFFIIAVLSLFTFFPCKLTNLVRNLAPSIAVTCILAYLTATLIRIHRLQDDDYVRKSLLSNPWVIGVVPNGILFSNMDNFEEDSSMQLCLKKYLEELTDIENGLTVFENICSKKNLQKKESISPSLTGEQLLYTLAVCELIIEQDHIKNRGFFTNPNPLDEYQQITHT